MDIIDDGLEQLDDGVQGDQEEEYDEVRNRAIAHELSSLARFSRELVDLHFNLRCRASALTIKRKSKKETWNLFWGTSSQRTPTLTFLTNSSKRARHRKNTQRE